MANCVVVPRNAIIVGSYEMFCCELSSTTRPCVGREQMSAVSDAGFCCLLLANPVVFLPPFLFRDGDSAQYAELFTMASNLALALSAGIRVDMTESYCRGVPFVCAVLILTFDRFRVAVLPARLLQKRRVLTVEK